MKIIRFCFYWAKASVFAPFSLFLFQIKFNFIEPLMYVSGWLDSKKREHGIHSMALFKTYFSKFNLFS